MQTEFAHEFACLFVSRNPRWSSGLRGACLGVSVNSRAQAARQARINKQRAAAIKEAQIALIWVAFTLATFAASYGLVAWVMA